MLPAVSTVGMVVLVGWILAEANPTFTQDLFGQSQLLAVSDIGGIPTRIDSSPTGAQVRIDGAALEKTPLEVSLSPGRHALKLQHPDTLDEEDTVQVSGTAASVDINLWRRHPDVVALRPVYPGAFFVDARFLNDGQVAIVVGLPVQPGAGNPNREVWLLDPHSGQMRKLDVPGQDFRASSMSVAPDDNRVAYVRMGSSPPFTGTGWSPGALANATTQMAEPDSVWLASPGSNLPSRKLFELPPADPPSTHGTPERIADLIWSPDESQLVAVTRQAGPSAHARVFLLNPSAPPGNDGTVAQELVALPAEVVPGSATIAPDGGWLALIAHAAATPNGSDLFSLCVLQLRAGGGFRDIAQLGSTTPAPVLAPVAWPPRGETGDNPILFAGPAPAASAATGGIFGIFGTLRPAPPPAGLFATHLEPSSVADVQPLRLGRAINNFGLVWRSETTLYAFAPEDDGRLALHSVDPATGVVTDLGVRVSAGSMQASAGLSVRWDTHDGSALLLAHTQGPSLSTADPTSAPLQVYLVSFVARDSSAALGR
ncbi:MAG: PEGA domain-containing protein [Chloroflexi bacterium]|nr:PEGA domain-containing protein [Chloroflexota bacterium]